MKKAIVILIILIIFLAKLMFILLLTYLTVKIAGFFFNKVFSGHKTGDY